MTVSEATEVLGQNPGARVLAGGTDLMVQMRLTRNIPELIVDVKNIAATREIALSADGLVLGAAVPAVDLTDHPTLRQVYPGVVEAAELIGSSQIQSRASLGGNLCHSSPAADTVPALMAVGAVCRIAGPTGERRVAVEEFCTGPGSNVLADGEFLVSFEIPAPGAGTRDAYLRFIPRNEMDIAVVGSGVSVTLDSSGTCTAARVAFGSGGADRHHGPRCGRGADRHRHRGRRPGAGGGGGFRGRAPDHRPAWHRRVPPPRRRRADPACLRRGARPGAGVALAEQREKGDNT